MRHIGLSSTALTPTSVAVLYSSGDVRLECIQITPRYPCERTILRTSYPKSEFEPRSISCTKRSGDLFSPPSASREFLAEEMATCFFNQSDIVIDAAMNLRYSSSSSTTRTLIGEPVSSTFLIIYFSSVISSGSILAPSSEFVAVF